jgi:prepilin-type processing-associated H-X9-DG protein
LGRVNVGYVDGHVETKPIGVLANRGTGLSTMDTLWSPLDESQNH